MNLTCYEEDVDERLDEESFEAFIADLDRQVHIVNNITAAITQIDQKLRAILAGCGGSE